MSEVLTYDFHEIDSGPGGIVWEESIDGKFASTIHNLDWLLSTIGSVIREGHIVRIHTVAEYYAEQEREAAREEVHGVPS